MGADQGRGVLAHGRSRPRARASALGETGQTEVGMVGQGSDRAGNWKLGPGQHPGSGWGGGEHARRMAEGSWGAVGALGRGLSQVVTGRCPRQAGEGMRARAPVGRGDMAGAAWAPRRPPAAVTTQGSSRLPARAPHGAHSACPGASALPAPHPGCSFHTSWALCPPHDNLHCLSPAKPGG